MRLASFTKRTGALTIVALIAASSAWQTNAAAQSPQPAANANNADVAEHFDATSSPTTQPAATQAPALPPGHPPLPGSVNSAPSAQLPAGHPPLPSGVGPVDPQKVAGKSLPAGHPPVNPNSTATTNPVGAGLKMPPLPPDSASLDIRIVQGTAGAAAITSGTPMLELYDGEKLFASMPTPLEEDGHIHIYDIPIQKPYVPLVKMNYAGVEYEVAGEPISPSQLAQEIAITVYEPTATPPEWLIRMRHVMLQPTPAHLEVNEVIVIENPGDRVFVPGKDGAGKSEAAFAIPLPIGAHDVHVVSGFGASRMAMEDGKLVNRVGMLPGQSQYQIAYALPVRDGAVELVFAAPVTQKSVAVLLPDDDSRVEAHGLTSAGINDMGTGSKVRLYKALDVPPGSDINVRVSGVAQAQTAAPPAEKDEEAAHLVEPSATQPHATVAKPSAQRFAIVGVLGVVAAGLTLALKRGPQANAGAAASES